MITESVVVDVSQDWVAACGLQERFMEIPTAKAQRLSYHARCRQMRALGGDCFHFVPLPGRCIGLAVVDASGKGLPAALIVANVQSSLRTGALFAPDDPQPTSVRTTPTADTNATPRTTIDDSARQQRLSSRCLTQAPSWISNLIPMVGCLSGGAGR